MQLDAHSLRTFEFRVRLARAFRGMAYGLVAAGLLGLVLVAADYLGWIVVTWQTLGWLTAGFVATGLAVGLLTPLNHAALAQSVDRRADLKERLQTSFESPAGFFGEAQIQDTSVSVAGLRAARLYPFKLSKWHLAGVALLAMAGGFFAFTTGVIVLSKNKAENLEKAKTEAERVERISKPLIEDEGKLGHDALDLEYLKQLEAYRRELKRGRLNEEQAADKLGNLNNSNQSNTEKQWSQFVSQSQTAQEALAKSLSQKMASQSGLSKEEAQAAMSQMKDMMSKGMSSEQIQAKANELSQKLAELEKKMAEIQKEMLKPGANMKALQQQLKGLQQQALDVKLSQKTLEWLEKVARNPEFKKLMELLAKLQKQQGQQPSSQDQQQAQLTQQQLEKMEREMEELATKFPTDEDIKRLIQQIMEALKNGRRACRGAGICPLGMPGPGGGQHPGYMTNFSKPKLDKPVDFQSHGPELNASHSVAAPANNANMPYIETRGPAKLTVTHVPVAKILPKYAHEAEKAVESEQIPRRQSERVKRYFESLQGGTK